MKNSTAALSLVFIFSMGNLVRGQQIKSPGGGKAPSIITTVLHSEADLTLMPQLLPTMVTHTPTPAQWDQFKPVAKELLRAEPLLAIGGPDGVILLPRSQPIGRVAILPLNGSTAQTTLLEGSIAQHVQEYLDGDDVNSAYGAVKDFFEGSSAMNSKVTRPLPEPGRKPQRFVSTGQVVRAIGAAFEKIFDVAPPPERWFWGLLTPIGSPAIDPSAAGNRLRVAKKGIEELRDLIYIDGVGDWYDWEALYNQELRYATRKNPEEAQERDRLAVEMIPDLHTRMDLIKRAKIILGDDRSNPPN